MTPPSEQHLRDVTGADRMLLVRVAEDRVVVTVSDLHENSVSVVVARAEWEALLRQAGE